MQFYSPVKAKCLQLSAVSPVNRRAPRTARLAQKGNMKKQTTALTRRTKACIAKANRKRLSFPVQAVTAKTLALHAEISRRNSTQQLQMIIEILYGAYPLLLPKYQEAVDTIREALEAPSPLQAELQPYFRFLEHRSSSITYASGQESTEDEEHPEVSKRQPTKNGKAVLYLVSA
jgi:hypothetical protein